MTDNDQMMPAPSAGEDPNRMFGHHGPPPYVSLRHKLRRTMPRLEDAILDRWVTARMARIRRTDRYRALPPLDVLAVGVQSARRPGAMDEIFRGMESGHHRMTFDQKGVDGTGKLENINILMRRHDLSRFDWVWMVDDDVRLPKGFTDTLLAFAEAAELKIMQPAHRAKSFASYPMTRRRHDALVRQTSYVEVGPITCFRREAFADVFPLPDLRWGWGLDLTWPALCRERGWRMGIVDAAPIEHTSPVAKDYTVDTAVQEAKAYISQKSFLPRDETWLTLRKWNALPAAD